MSLSLTLAILGLLSLPLSVQLENQLLRNKVIYSLHQLVLNYPEQEASVKNLLISMLKYYIYK